MTSILEKLRPWQAPIYRECLSGLETGNFLNASGLGSGKSFCAIAVAKTLQKPVLIVCRLGSRRSWTEVANHFGYPTDMVHTINREMLRTGKTEWGRWEFGEANHNTGKRAKRFVWMVPKDWLLVVDECHWDSGVSSLNSKVLIAAVEQGYKIMALSGTAADDPRKMKAIGYMLGLHRNADFHQWLFRQGATVNDWDCGVIGDHSQERERRRKATMARIHSELTQAHRLVHLSTQQIPGFPKCAVYPIAVDFGVAQMSLIYAEMQAELATLGGNKAKEREALMRARQRTELLEVPGLVDEVNEGIAEGQAVAVFLNFKASVVALVERLGTDCVYTGDQSPEVREANRMRFQDDQSPVIVLTKSAGSESLDLADRHGDYPRLGLMIPGFFSLTDNQCLGRLPRDGAKTPSIYKIIFASGTVEEAAYRACKRRTEMYDIFNGFTDSDLTAGIL